MEMKFNETSCQCLRRLVDQNQTREFTQEVRLPEGMPDIGKLLGCWGKVIIRGKEWRSGSMAVNGGVMAWVLYAPEDGSQIRSMEVWIPVQLKWELPETQRDGFVWVLPRLKSMDARSTSARKMMVRANVSVIGRAMESVQTPVYEPVEVPQDVQLLTATYPMELPRESGEKVFTIEEELPFPQTLPAVENLLRYDLCLQIREQKVMASRVVFRGEGRLHMLYCSDGKLYTWDCQIPFSQFGELDWDHSAHASAQICPVLTDLELTKGDTGLQLKAGVAAQYVISDRVLVTLAEDAYSPQREVQLQEQELLLPMGLDSAMTELRAQQTLQTDAAEILDICWMPEHPQRQQNGDMAELILPGQFQLLTCNAAGEIQCTSTRYEQQISIPAGEQTRIDADVTMAGMPQAVRHGDAWELMTEFRLETAVSGQGLQRMICGLELGQLRPADPNRPSLILRRCEDGLWNTAKKCGSTVEAIRRANGLHSEPEWGQMLLIPVC